MNRNSQTMAAGSRPVGTFEGYVDGAPSVTWLDRDFMPEVGATIYAVPHSEPKATAFMPRRWALLLTSANHGAVGPVGSTFPHAGERHERVLVIEVPPAAGAPVDQVDLRIVAAPAGDTLTDEQIAAGAAVKCDCGKPIGRNTAIDAFDAMRVASASTVLTDERIENLWHEACLKHLDLDDSAIPEFARAIEREVSAQAGQVAVPEGWRLVPVEPTEEMVGAGFESAPDEFFSPAEEWEAYAEMTGCQKAAHRARLCYAAMLAAAPAAPAQAKPLPAPEVSASAEPIECWSHNEEDFNAQSLGELVDTHELAPGATVWVGEAVHPEPASLFSTDWLIENMGEAAYDIGGEHAGEDYPNVSDEQVAELEALVVGWIAKCAPPTFWTVKNVRPYVLTAEDCGAQASTAGGRQEGGQS